MNHLFNEVNAWVHTLVLGLLMCGGWGYGCWRVRSLAKYEGDNATSQLTGASVALFGLLLAFTFSLSQERHEHRRQMVVEHANTIGDFATCASMLKDPVRTRLLEDIRKYVEHFIAMRTPYITESELQRGLEQNERMHEEMQSLVKEAVDDGTPIAISLVNTFNDVTSSHDARLAAIRNRLPTGIVVLLFLSATVSMIQIGMQHGRLDEREFTTGIGFILLVCLCVWVTLDSNQMNANINSISQEPLHRLRSNLSH